jgi:sigma-E factor negative regulatory protein RseC
MLTETGRVVAVEAGSLWVETIRQSTCGSCSANKACGHGLLNQLGGGRSHFVRVLPGEFDAEQFVVDEEVTIAIPEQVMLQGSFLVYVVPLLGMLAGAALAPSLSTLVVSDLAAVVGAICGMGVGVLLVRYHSARHSLDPRFQPRLLGRASVASDAIQVQ